jgi:hypothetical protein
MGGIRDVDIGMGARVKGVKGCGIGVVESADGLGSAAARGAGARLEGGGVGVLESSDGDGVASGMRFDVGVGM